MDWQIGVQEIEYMCGPSCFRLAIHGGVFWVVCCLCFFMFSVAGVFGVWLTLCGYRSPLMSTLDSGTFLSFLGGK